MSDNRAARRWDAEFAQLCRPFLDFGEAVTADRAVVAMDAVGVDAALITTMALYPDIDCAVEAVTRYPTRFGVVAQIDLSRSHPERLVDRYRTQTDLAAIRLVFLTPEGEAHYRRLDAGEFEPVLAAASRHGLPVMLVVSGRSASGGGDPGASGTHVRD